MSRSTAPNATYLHTGRDSSSPDSPRGTPSPVIFPVSSQTRQALFMPPSSSVIPLLLRTSRAWSSTSLQRLGDHRLADPHIVVGGDELLGQGRTVCGERGHPGQLGRLDTG